MKRLLKTIISYVADWRWPQQSPQRIETGHTQVWYGRVNWWASAGKRTLRKDLIRCAVEGVSGYHIEMAGWADTSGYRKQWGNDERLRDVEEMYEWLVKQCRALGLWLFVSITNDNAGSGKYGDAGIPLSRVREDVTRLISIVLRNGPDNVLVQPVGETQTSAGRDIENEAARALEGFRLVYNGNSRPTSHPPWAQYHAFHPFGTTAPVPSSAIVVSDTGSIINQLCEGLEGRGRPDAAVTWVRRVRDQGSPVACFYHFKYKEHDKAIIKALGRA